MKKPQRYLPENQIWYESDTFNNCKKKLVICSKCKHKGHISINLNQTTDRRYLYNPKTQQVELHLKRDFYVHHSHFIADTDKGRHVRCKIGFDHLPVSDDRIKTEYTLKDEENIIPAWVIDELNN